MLSAIVLTAIGLSQQPVELYRQWKPTTKLTYEVKTSLTVDSRHYMTSVFIPEDLEHKYQYTMDVGEVNAEGFAKVDYKRPEVHVTEGETVDHPPITKVEKINEHYQMSLSPINAITDLKDMTPKKSDKGGGIFISGLPIQDQNPVAGFIGDLYQLALFIGNAETSLDFGPRLPLLEVAPGDTWKVTASYQPQKLKDKKGKMAPQRLDYLYTYVGLVDGSGGKKVHRVTADLDLDTDIAPFINDLLGQTPAQSHLRGLKLKMKAHVDYDLDLQTKNTISARARSEGSLAIEVTDVPTVPVQEERLRGRTTLRLVSIK